MGTDASVESSSEAENHIYVSSFKENFVAFDYFFYWKHECTDCTHVLLFKNYLLD